MRQGRLLGQTLAASAEAEEGHGEVALLGGNHGRRCAAEAAPKYVRQSVCPADPETDALSWGKRKSFHRV